GSSELVRIAETYLFILRAVKYFIEILFRQLADGRVHRNPEMVRHRSQQLGVILRTRRFPRSDGMVFQRTGRIRDDQLGINLQFRSQSIAIRASTERTVK